jgi:ribosome biogenesis GTPase A
MAFVQMLARLEAVAASGVKPGLLENRYGVAVPPLAAPAATTQDSAQSVQNPDADGWLRAAAERHTSGDTARMAQRFLDDFRRGMLGPLALELP